MYGQWHPQAGEVIRSYSHKQELMKKYGWEEASDVSGGNRKLSEESKHEDYLADKEEAPTPSISWGEYQDKKRASGTTEIML